MQQTSVQKQNNFKNNLGGLKMKKFLKQLLNKRLNNEKGLTLVELLAVIVILAIIAAIAIPSIGNIINRSEDKAILAEASNILAGAKIAHVSGECDAEGTGEGIVACDQAVLAGAFVEGLPSDVTYSATLDKENGWSITYERFGELKATYTGLATDTISETDLNTALKEGAAEEESGS